MLKLKGEKNLTIIARILAGFVLAMLVKNSYILSRDPFMQKKY